MRKKEGIAGVEPGCLRKVGNGTFWFCVEFGITLLNEHLHYTLLVLENAATASQVCEYICLFLHVFLVSAFLDLLFSDRYMCTPPSGPDSDTPS